MSEMSGLFFAPGKASSSSGARPYYEPQYSTSALNDTDVEVLWLIVGAPEELELLPGAKNKPDISLIYPVDPKQLPKELAGTDWPPME